MIPTSPVVIKIGGSLLTLAGLAERLHSLLNSMSSTKVLFIIGGGAAADEVRRLDERFHFAPARAHWDAISAMTSNSKLISRILGSVPLVSDWDQAETAWQRHPAAILDASVFLRDKRAIFSQQLPESWIVTSDSIAACVALDWPCDQVIFCKSCDPVSPFIDEVCQAGQLDAYIPSLRSSLQDSQMQLNWLNLQVDKPSIRPLRWIEYSDNRKLARQ